MRRIVGSGSFLFQLLTFELKVSSMCCVAFNSVCESKSFLCRDVTVMRAGGYFLFVFNNIYLWPSSY